MFLLYVFMGLVGVTLGLLCPRRLAAEGAPPSPAGEAPGQPQGPYGGYYGNGGGPSPSSGPGASGPRTNDVTTWDDRVFNLDSAPQGPAVSPGGRYSADAPDYNTEQQADWKRSCASLRDRDSRAYRDCYQRQKARSQDAVRQSLQSTGRGGGPMRGMGPRTPLDEPGSVRLPSQDPALDPAQGAGNGNEND